MVEFVVIFITMNLCELLWFILSTAIRFYVDSVINIFFVQSATVIFVLLLQHIGLIQVVWRLAGTIKQRH